MTVPDRAPVPVQLRCHHCQRWLGETTQALEFVGMFRDPHDRALMDGPRETYRCKACGWVMVFREIAPPVASWRSMELKSG